MLKSLALGYEDLESVSLLSEEEIVELATSIKMRPGHRRKLHRTQMVAILMWKIIDLPPVILIVRLLLRFFNPATRTSLNETSLSQLRAEYAEGIYLVACDS